MDRTPALGYSPCPNDTYLFYALAHGLVGARPRVVLEDVETLNRWAMAGELELTKLSYAAFARVADRYVMLPSGGALGRGVGPLIVTRDPLETLDGRRIATPGGLTTANLLLDLWRPEGLERVEMRYDRVLPAVAAGEVDAGLIIHESRFTYREHGLLEHLDLGAWWEGETDLPLPLGGIAARRDLGPEGIAAADRAVRASLAYARAHPEEAEPYIARHAQEMSPDVRRRHIELYVNDMSEDLGAEGRAAARELFARAAARGVAPAVPEDAIAVPAAVGG